MSTRNPSCTHPIPRDEAFARIYRVVAAIPRGRVATYGQVALLAGLPRRARLVGRALASLGGESDLPWHRVINAQGRISPRDAPPVEHIQLLMLEDEGVEVDARGRIDLGRYRWEPDDDPA